MVLGSSPVAVTLPSDFAPPSTKEFLDIQATIECGFALKRVRDMTRIYSQMDGTDKFSEDTGSPFESSCSHFTYRFLALFEQGVP